MGTPVLTIKQKQKAEEAEVSEEAVDVECRTITKLPREVTVESYTCVTLIITILIMDPGANHYHTDSVCL